MRVIALALLASLAVTPAAAGVIFSADETRAILAHGPWPAPWQPDASNRVSGSAAGIDYGQRLFFDPRLSANGKFACSTCHVPALAWSDRRRIGMGQVPLGRNTPSVLNARHERWLGRDGASDSLWSHALKPLTDEREMGNSVERLAAFLRADADMNCRHARAFGAVPADDLLLAVEIAKALAAFQESLVTPRTSFDRFRDALAKGDRAGMARYSDAAKRGLRIFVGRGNCAVCHFGPTFSNGEFADIGVPFFLAPGKVDSGRHGGIARVQQDRFNRLSSFSDAGNPADAVGIRHLVQEHRHWGEFKVPGLREAVRTGPYMHAGSHATLGDVVRHYSELDVDRLHADGERILKPLNLNPRESADLVAFLKSLSVAHLPGANRPPTGSCS
ncbi:MAG: cytochrome-c peroxidase [Burkholderiales bacterium]